MSFMLITFYKCRYESFNSIMRARNIYGNKQAPSRDIATNLAMLEYLRYICSGGLYDNGSRSVF